MKAVICGGSVMVVLDLHKRFCDEGRKWPQAAAFHHMWSMAEDDCFAAWVQFCFSKRPKRLSLHFDGIRIHRDVVPDAAAFARASADHIFGRQLELLRHGAVQIETGPCTRTPAKTNCIPLSLARLIPEQASDIKLATERRNAENMASSLRGGRRYFEWGHQYGHDLVPHHGLALDASPRTLVHSDILARPVA